jgi:SAM-dependent methyltransferase
MSMTGMIERSWMTSFRLPDGTMTKEGGRRRRGKDFTKTKLVNDLNVKGKTVLDVGCSEGVYSFYLAQNGATVTGIDLDPIRISNARFIKEILGFDSVNFIEGSVAQMVNPDLDRYFLVLAYGFLHRIADPINFILNAGNIADNVAFEWRAPALLPTSSLGLAIHNPVGFFEWKNFERYEHLDLVAESKYKQGARLADFLRVSPAMVVSLLQRIGFRSFELKVVQREYQWGLLPKSILSVLRSAMGSDIRPCDWPHSRRVHLLASRTVTGDVWKKEPGSRFRPAPWDGRFL